MDPDTPHVPYWHHSSNLDYLKLIPSEGILQQRFVTRLRGFIGRDVPDEQARKVAKSLLVRGLVAEQLERNPETGLIRRILVPKVKA